MTAENEIGSGDQDWNRPDDPRGGSVMDDEKRVAEIRERYEAAEAEPGSWEQAQFFFKALKDIPWLLDRYDGLIRKLADWERMLSEADKDIEMLEAKIRG